VFLQGPTIFGPGSGSFGANISVELSKSGNILESTQGPNFGQSSYAVYNMNMQSSINLSTLSALVNAGFSDIRAFSIDDEGRILAWANNTSNPNSPLSDDLVLLTPAGVSSDPIALNVPEPGSLSVMMLLLGAFAAHRVQVRRTSKPS
jgi:hypothetical protein